jgi:hypothetical protein
MHRSRKNAIVINISLKSNLAAVKLINEASKAQKQNKLNQKNDLLLSTMM